MTFFHQGNELVSNQKGEGEGFSTFQKYNFGTISSRSPGHGIVQSLWENLKYRNKGKKNRSLHGEACVRACVI